MKLLSPLIQKWIGSAVRGGLTTLGGYLIAKGLITDDQSVQVIALAPILAGLAWSAYEKYTSRQKLVTAMAQPAAVSEQKVEAIIKAGDAVSVTVSKDVTPRP